MKYDRHPLSDIFPEIQGQDFESLQADIKENGLLHPITVYEGKIIDGWNRYRACLAAKVKYRLVDLPPGQDPVAFVISENVKRRHLNPSQLALVGQTLLEYEEAEAAKRKAEAAAQSNKKRAEKSGEGKVTPTGPSISKTKEVLAERRKATEAVAEKLGISAKTISDAKLVKEKAPEMVEKIMRGEKVEGRRAPSVSGVANSIRNEEDKQREFDRLQKQAAEKAAAPLVTLLKEAVMAGHSFSRAIALYRQRINEHQKEGVFPRSPELLRVFAEYQQMLSLTKAEMEREYAEVLKVQV